MVLVGPGLSRVEQELAGRGDVPPDSLQVALGSGGYSQRTKPHGTTETFSGGSS